MFYDIDNRYKDTKNQTQGPLFTKQVYHVFCRDTLSIEEETAIKPRSQIGTKMYQSFKMYWLIKKYILQDRYILQDQYILVPFFS